MSEKKVKRMIHACPGCGEKFRGKGTGLLYIGLNEEGKTLLRCSQCGWSGLKVECVATEKVEDQQ